MNLPSDSRWTILSITRPGGHGKEKQALVRCECGTEKTLPLNSVKSGRSRSCGCLAGDVNGPRLARQLTKHGETANGGRGSRLYQSWRGMRERCLNPGHVSWPRYGGRGIVIAPEWSDFATFRDWANANGYVDGLTIDRIDNDGNYEPGNCQWLTRSENSRRRHMPHQRDEAAQKMEAILG